MKNSFSALSQNMWSRKFGGTSVGVADPYLTGYHFIWFARLPASLTAYTQLGPSGLSSVSDVQKVLSASCTGVTPPGGTLNKVDFTGLGGSKWAVPGNTDYGDTVSLKFIEFNRLPILDIFHGWVKMIRDYRTGTAGAVLQDNLSGAGYTKSTYAGLLYYWTTAPDGITVEYSACYDGVFPMKDPQDLYSSDVETVGRLDVEIDFNIDYAWHEKWVQIKCQSLANNMFAASRTNVENQGATQAAS